MLAEIAIQFYLLGERGQRITEAELRTQISQHRERLRNDAEYEGVLELRTPNTTPFVIEDSLPALVKNFCFLSIPDLVASKSAVYHYHSQYGQIQLNPEVDMVRISGDDNAPLLVGQAVLLRSIYDCGLRFIDLLELVQGDVPDTEIASLIVFLNQHRAVAHAALLK